MIFHCHLWLQEGTSTMNHRIQRLVRQPALCKSNMAMDNPRTEWRFLSSHGPFSISSQPCLITFLWSIFHSPKQNIMVYPLVNVYITNWKIAMLSMGESSFHAISPWSERHFAMIFSRHFPTGGPCFGAAFRDETATARHTVWGVDLPRLTGHSSIHMNI